MNEAKYPKMLTVCFAILAVTIPLFNLAVAEELEAVVKQKDVHPRIASQLEQLKNDAISRTKATQTDAQRMITVVLFAEPGATIDETALEAYGGEIIKRVANVWKARVPIDRIETIADHVDGVVFINLPNKAKPLTISQGVVWTGSANYHSTGHTGSGVTIGVIDSEFAKVAEAIAAN